MGTSNSAPAAPTLTVRVDAPGAAINSTQWGVFFEDINFGGDGGLHAEWVKNRSFEFPDPWMGWKATAATGAQWAVRQEDPASPGNPRYVRLTANAGGLTATTSGAAARLVNEGFRGVGVRAGETYDFRVLARQSERGAWTLRVRLRGETGAELAVASLDGFTGAWREHTVRLRAHGTDAHAHLEVELLGVGFLDLDMVSLYPTKTWKGRPRGMRADLVQWLADLRPGFVRFPGGCIVEGKVLDTRYQWKTTIGAPADRRLIVNRWNDEFRHRPAPDYYQSFGVGFFEFFQLCDDLGAAPVPILNCGMACQFNSGQLADLDALDPYLQDALDLVEFANGPVDSPWGARRAALGHPRPFGMRHLGIGNEQWGPQYLERYARFAKVLKVKYPELQLIGSAGPGPEDDKFQFLWPRLRDLGTDLIDEHCYAPAEWFLRQTHRYDGYDRNGPKIFMGEYAVQSVRTGSPENRNTWGCALAEAAYMTGLERNAAVVTMSSYAPLFAHVDAWQWTPNLIWFDNLHSYATPSYHVQRLFARNRGERVLPVELAGLSDRVYATAASDRGGRDVVLKVVNATSAEAEFDIHLAGARRVNSRVQVITLGSAGLEDENSLDQPARVAPRESEGRNGAARFTQRFAANSLTILRLGARGEE